MVADAAPGAGEAACYTGRVANGMIHEVLPVGWLACNCSVIGDPETREAVVIDPGDEVARILEIIARHDLKVRALVNTHAHIDHVGGLRKLKEATGAPVLMHAEDLDLYRMLEVQAEMIGMPVPPAAEVDGFLRDGDAVRWGKYRAEVIHTPGHTRGSLCLYLPAADERGDASRKLFAGDTLFAGSIGRTDLWGGSLEQILHSLHTRLLALPDDTVVFPGHGPSTSIGQERETNPFLLRRWS
jgi:glyoxylase-like metal-dependent hydrolase (beta-lactamase superfamily II)